MTPTQRALQHLRDRGYMAEVVEYWQPSFANRAVVDAAKEFASNPDSSVKLEQLRCKVAQLEQFGPGKRQDLFNFVDIVAVGNGHILAVQCTSTSGLSARLKKITSDCQDAAVAWLKNQGMIEVHGWKRYAKAENRKFWRPTIRGLALNASEVLTWHDKPVDEKSQLHRQND